MVRFQPKLLLLKTMSESLTMQQQGSVLMSVAHIITRKHGDILGLGDHMYVQELCRTAPAPHWLWPSGELAPSLTTSSTRE